MSQFVDEIDGYKKSIDACIVDIFSNIKDSVIKDAMYYSVFSGGKRLRPLLCIGVCKDLISIFKNLDIICAIEFIHTYSFIHDDLPSMDNDKERRGLPTCHIKFGEAMAILAGDGLLNLAFEVVVNSKSISDAKKIKVIKSLSVLSGSNGMLLGQCFDMNLKYKKIDFDMLLFVYKLKSCRLIQSAVEIGCILADFSDSMTKKMNEFATNFGTLFQIIDDINDYKEKNEEMNIVSIIGLDSAKEYAKDFYLKTMNILDQFEKKNELFEFIVKTSYHRMVG